MENREFLERKVRELIVQFLEGTSGVSSLLFTVSFNRDEDLMVVFLGGLEDFKKTMLGLGNFERKMLEEWIERNRQN